MASVNKWIGIGHLGKDVDMRYSANGDAIANFSIACSESWKDKATGEKKEQTEWVRISYFGKLAEICGQYLKKGSQVYVEGSLRTRKWTDQNGVEKYTTEIRGDEMKMLGGKPEGGQRQHDDQGYEPAPQKQQTQRNSQGAPPSKDFSDLDDDIPFTYHARGRIGHCM